MVIGGGAAGIAALRRLHALGVQRVELLEARARLGGRACQLRELPMPVRDAGAQWLHAADRNPLVALLEAQAIAVHRQSPDWGAHAVAPRLSAAPLQRLESALAVAAARSLELARGPLDRPLADALPAAGGHAPLQALLWTLMSGDEPERVSVRDYTAFLDTGHDWSVVDGLGGALQSLAQPLMHRVRLDAPVLALDWRREPVQLRLAQGTCEARRVIVTVPVGVLAAGGLDFTPSLPASHREALATIAPGAAEKGWLLLRRDIPGLPVGAAFLSRADRRRAAWFVVLARDPPCLQGLVAGDCARELGQEPGAVADFVCEELVALFGSRAHGEVQLRRETHWQRDPLTRGAYSHVPPGGAALREALACTVGERLWFAGEACSHNAAGAIHGAWETGEAAAEAVARSLERASRPRPRGGSSALGC